MPTQNTGVSIVTCTNRPQFFTNILANFKSQLYAEKELIIVLNNDTMALRKYRWQIRQYKNVQVYKLAGKVSLGRCLNFAVGKTMYPFIAKFDDDDYYSPYYLTEQMKVIHTSGADIVGKRAYLVYLEGRQLLIMRYPSQRNRFFGLVSGGTLLFNRAVVNRVRFADISLGEDVAFLRSSKRAGYKIYASTPYNYVAIRRKSKLTHTWRATDSQLLQKSRVVAKTTEFRKLAVRR